MRLLQPLNLRFQKDGVALERLIGRFVGGVFLAGLVDPTAAYAQNVDQVTVYIRCIAAGKPDSEGSGVLVSADGFVLTARHVVPDGYFCQGAIANSTLSLRGLERTSRFARLDAMLLRFVPSSGEQFPYVGYCPLRPGLKARSIVASGFFPDAGDPDQRPSPQPSPRNGILSSSIPDQYGIVQTTVPTTRGMSGGPVLLEKSNLLLGILAGAVFDLGTGQPQYYSVLAVQEVAAELGLLPADTCENEQLMTSGQIATPSVQGSGGSVALVGNVSQSTITVFNQQQDLPGLVAIFTSQFEVLSAAWVAAEHKAATLGAQLGLTQQAVIGLVKLAGEQAVPSEQLPVVLAQVTVRYKAQLQRLGDIEAALAADDPEIASLVAQARTAIEQLDFKAADALLQRAEEADLAAAERARLLIREAEATANVRQLRAAAARVERGEAARTERRYGEAAAHFAQAAKMVPTGQDAYRLEYLWREANALQEQGETFGINSALEQAVERWTLLLAEYRRETAPLDWAMVQNNLGVALQTRGEREKDKMRLQTAVAAYRAALEERTRERVPLDWAQTQNNLGLALVRLGERESDSERLEQAVAAYRAALEERTRELVPFDWAKTQTRLGFALARLGEREGSTKRLEQAVMAFRAALEKLTREIDPLDWAQTQNNLGLALQTLGERAGDTTLLEQAVTAYRAALEERTREAVPLDWAQTQNNLGNSLATLGAWENNLTLLEDAIVAYRAALEERTPERVPLDWAQSQNNLGNALAMLGEREGSAARLQEAVVAYRAALEMRTREAVPLAWAETQNNLGLALATLGEWENGTARLQEAVVAYRAALEMRTREAVPLAWAETQNNLGLALATLGERETGTTRLQEAAVAYRSALVERTRARVPLDWAWTQNSLGVVLDALGRRDSNMVWLEEAVLAYRAALEERTHDRWPLERARTQNNLGNVLDTLGRRESGTVRLEEAVEIWEECLPVITQAWPAEWVRSVRSSCNEARAEIGRRAGRANLQDAGPSACGG